MPNQLSLSGSLIDIMRFSEDGVKLPTEIQILPIGKWDTPNHGSFEITKSMLEEAVKNFKEGKLRLDIPITIEHGESSHYKDAAAAWFKDIYVKDDGLYGSTEWTKLGEEMLGNKIYKYISAEYDFKHQDKMNKSNVVSNVLTAATLTNKPLFRNLKPMMCDEVGGNLTDNKLSIMLISNPMLKLSEIVLKTPDSLNADEKEFLKVHASELTDDQKKTFGLMPKEEKKDEKPKTDAGISAKEEVVSISATELAELKANAAKGADADKKLKFQEGERTITKLLFSEEGAKIKAASKDDFVNFYNSLDETQQKMFTEKIITALPEVKLFKEEGSGEDVNVDTKNAGLKLHELTLERAKKDGIAYEAAQSLVANENPEIAKLLYPTE